MELEVHIALTKNKQTKFNNDFKTDRDQKHT
jgi:hypothetical protein